MVYATTYLDVVKIKNARGTQSATVVAEKLGITYEHLLAVERGFRKPSVGLLLRMANLYGLEVGSFFSKKNVVTA